MLSAKCTYVGSCSHGSQEARSAADDESDEDAEEDEDEERSNDNIGRSDDGDS